MKKVEIKTTNTVCYMEEHQIINKSSTNTTNFKHFFNDTTATLTEPSMDQEDVVYKSASEKDLNSSHETILCKSLKMLTGSSCNALFQVSNANMNSESKKHN